MLTAHLPFFSAMIRCYAYSRDSARSWSSLKAVLVTSKDGMDSVELGLGLGFSSPGSSTRNLSWTDHVAHRLLARQPDRKGKAARARDALDPLDATHPAKTIGVLCRREWLSREL